MDEIFYYGFVIQCRDSDLYLDVNILENEFKKLLKEEITR